MNRAHYFYTSICTTKQQLDEEKIIFKSERQNEQLITETCIIRKVSTMNLNEGFYKSGSIMINSLQSHPRIKKAVSMCKTG